MEKSEEEGEERREKKIFLAMCRGDALHVYDIRIGKDFYSILLFV
jgi:hypothetical protein